MKQIILLSTNLDFTWFVIDGFMEALSSPPIQNFAKKFEILPTPSYNIQKIF